MTFQQMMWKVAMVLFIAMMLVNVGVCIGRDCAHAGEDYIDCRNGDVEPELDDLEKLSDAVKW